MTNSGISTTTAAILGALALASSAKAGAIVHETTCENNACATAEEYTPNRGMREYEYVYYINAFGGSPSDPQLTSFDMRVTWDDSNDAECKATIDGMLCDSCVRCDVHDRDYPVSVDCRNLQSEIFGGKAATCEPLTDGPWPFVEIRDQVPPPPKPQYCYITRDELKRDVDKYIQDPSAFETRIGEWCVEDITDFSSLFSGYEDFNEPLDKWDTSKATNMHSMFNGATSFNQPLNHFDVSKVTNMRRMFENAKAFNQDLDKWNTESLERTNRMFRFAWSFDGDVSTWKTGKIVDMSEMFHHARVFDQDLSKWNVSRVTNMALMFAYAERFSSNIALWKTGQVINMRAMFASAHAFNSPLRQWDVSRVTSMRQMFLSANAFNQDISSWDVSQVANMDFMFEKAQSFNKDLCEWRFDFFDTKPSVVKMFSESACNALRDPEFSLERVTSWCHICDP